MTVNEWNFHRICITNLNRADLSEQKGLKGIILIALWQQVVQGGPSWMQWVERMKQTAGTAAFIGGVMTNKGVMFL